MEDRGEAKPTLIIVPWYLLEQWVTEFNDLCPDVFGLYVYHGDVNDVHSLAHGCRKVPGILFSRDSHKNPMHQFFDTSNEDNADIVIFTTPQTLAARHGPVELKKWRKNHSIEDADRHEYDHTWERGLAGKFQTVIIDEAHIIKGISTDITATIKWLMAVFLILMTGTPLFNGIPDLKGFMTLLEHPNAKKWWDKLELARMGVESDLNPWSLPDDHEGAKLRLTDYAVKEFLLDSSMNAFQKGQYLEKIYEKCLLRRTHASTLRELGNKVIGQALPRVKAAFLNCKFTSEEMKNYRASMEKHLPFIIKPSANKKRPKFNLGVFRKMNMLSIWHPLVELEEKGLDLRATNQRKLLDDTNLANRWFDTLSPTDSLDNTARLMTMCTSAPGTRALLKNMKSQVSPPSRRQCTPLE